MAEVLRVHGLSVSLGKRRVLHDVSVEAPFGEVSAIIGPNGAGKSTLLRAVSGLIAHAGRVDLGHTALAEMDVAERAKLLSFVPQSSQLSAAMAVREVVLQGRYVHRRAFRRARPEDAQAVDEAMRETDVARFSERAFTELSFGEQRRVLIARALATGARTIMLDEPTAALDIEHALRLYRLLRQLAAQGRCIVVVLHDLDHVRSYADRAVLLKEGRVVAAGASRAVLSPAQVRAVYRVDLIEGAGLGFRLPEAP